MVSDLQETFVKHGLNTREPCLPKSVSQANNAKFEGKHSNTLDPLSVSVPYNFFDFLNLLSPILALPIFTICPDEKALYHNPLNKCTL